MNPSFVAMALSWLACLGLGAGMGGWVGRMPLHTQLATVRATQAETAKLQAQASARALQTAHERGNALSIALAAAQTQAHQLQKAQHATLQTLATGRACLHADAVRLLNQPDATAPGGPEPVPPPPGGAAATGAAFATDADVGHWAIDARAAHTDCRQRLDALIDWHTP